MDMHTSSIGSPQLSPDNIFSALENMIGKDFEDAVLLEPTLDIRISQADAAGRRLTAQIKDGYYPFMTSVSLYGSSKSGEASGITEHCACYQHNCLHGAAVLLRFFRNKHPELSLLLDKYAGEVKSLSDSARVWLNTLRTETILASQRTVPARSRVAAPERVLFYVLEPRYNSIELRSVKLLKKGGYSVNHRIEQNWSRALQGKHYMNDDLFSEDDRRIARTLFLEGIELPRDTALSLADIGKTDVILNTLLTSGRLVGPDYNFYRPLHLGEAIPASVRWREIESGNGHWMLERFCAARPKATFLNTSPEWYFDQDSGAAGPVIGELSSVVKGLISCERVITYKDIPALQRAIGKLNPISDLPPLPTVDIIDLGVLMPRPALFLSGSDPVYAGQHISENGYVTGTVFFDYQGIEVSPNSGCDIVHFENGRLTRIVRDVAYEESCMVFLASLAHKEVDKEGYLLIVDGDSDAEKGGSYLSRALAFQQSVIPRLRKYGWGIEFDKDFNVRLIDAGTWSLNFNENSKGWYDVRLETEIDGRSVDLVGVLRRLLENPTFVQDILSDKDDGSNWWSRLPTGEFLSVPIDVVKRLARLLLDIGTAGGNDSKSITISRFDVDLLRGIQGESRIVVKGADDLRLLAYGLSQDPEPLREGILDDLALPLRDYQLEGVAWMRSRLGMGLGVILGDQMAIGKTIQTLAHIWIENRSCTVPPSLIIVPPTLLSKWIEEKEKFIPAMKIWLHHGPNRGESMSVMRGENHVVLTSYRTLVLDLAEFLEHEWHIVACDEGHDLRNPQAEMTRAVEVLRAKQKIVISGTPIQNNLVDLWAVINVAVPGLLRDLKWFRQRFVLEPQKDASLGSSRSRLLGRMTAPFRLSRTNKEVGNALPPVNTVFRHIDMGEEQREVYETMRAAMDKDVRALIAKSGLAKNHISILAAISRLRQICCHPALAKSDMIPAETPSAKLDYLMSMVDELRAEGKAVVIVSQWVEMLHLISSSLFDKDIDHRLLVGKGMTLKKRKIALEDFRSGKIKFLLMSLGVGGVGLDIPEGNVVIIFDPWWNSKKIEQAIARLTRDDRENNITAYHLIIKGSLEEGVLRIADKKGEMIAAVMEGGAGAVSGLDLTDIEMLFRPSDSI